MYFIFSIEKTSCISETPSLGNTVAAQGRARPFMGLQGLLPSMASSSRDVNLFFGYEVVAPAARFEKTIYTYRPSNIGLNTTPNMSIAPLAIVTHLGACHFYPSESRILDKTVIYHIFGRHSIDIDEPPSPITRKT